MLRAILLLLALAILVVIALAYTGVLNFRAESGTAPKFGVEVKDVNVGTTTTNVQLPAVEMKTRQVEVPTLQVEGGNEAEGQ